MPNIIESLNASMLRDPRWTPHQDRRAGGTKYISTFVNRRGDVIALDLGSGGKCAIWAQAQLSPSTLAPAVDRELYPSNRPAQFQSQRARAQGQAADALLSDQPQRGPAARRSLRRRVTVPKPGRRMAAGKSALFLCCEGPRGSTCPAIPVAGSFLSRTKCQGFRCSP